MTLAFGSCDRPVLPRGVRLHQDHVRGGMVLLGPEKAVALDTVGTAILTRLDGQTSFAALVHDLAATYDAPTVEIERDVQAFLVGLRARMFLEVGR